MIFIIRSGIQILADHPRLYWTRHSTPGHWFRIQKAVPADPLWTAKHAADFSDIGGGYGGYNPDHEFFGYRQTI
jgi:hypothetical protein